MATPGEPLLQVPPPVALLSVTVDPAHTDAGPVIGVAEFTVIVNVVKHPIGDVYMMTEVPGDTPYTTPVPDVIVATFVLLLVHVPDVVILLSVTDPPWHTVEGPVIGATALTVTVITELQPPPAAEYVIRAVPVDTPVTMPLDDPTVAIVVFVVVHVPPGVALLSVVVLPTHIAVVPVIGLLPDVTLNVSTSQPQVVRTRTQ